MHVSLPEVDAIDRAKLRDSRGRSFSEFKRMLTPRWSRVWIDIGAAYVALALIMVALAGLERTHPAWITLWTVLGAIAFGYTIAYTQLFLHEAVHFNVAPGRKLNDALANLFLGLIAGQDVRVYRTVHFDHHRHLGTIRDTERSYFDALNARFILHSLVGIKALSVLRFRGAHVETKPGASQRGVPAATMRRRRLNMLAASAAANLALVVTALALGHWAIGLGWLFGQVSVHPCINAVRQLLEHRRYDARSDVDYAATPHGAHSGMFGAGIIASTLGGAGFNRHLLHHWEPQISYTRLAELEAYLLDTPSRDVFRAQTSTYARAFRRLLRAP